MPSLITRRACLAQTAAAFAVLPRMGRVDSGAAKPTTRIKIGQLGIGHNHGAAKMASFLKLKDDYEVVGVVEPDPAWRKKRENEKAYQGLKWMTEEELFAVPGLQLVSVETDVPDLTDAALRCVRAGLRSGFVKGSERR